MSVKMEGVAVISGRVFPFPGRRERCRVSFLGVRFESGCLCDVFARGSTGCCHVVFEVVEKYFEWPVGWVPDEAE